MVKLNENYKKLKVNYLFADIAKRVKDFQAKNPSLGIIRMGIGDVTMPLALPVVSALKNASQEMGAKETFKGYGEYQGYPFLQQAIKDYYTEFGVDLSLNETFVSDGAKSDVANFAELFSEDNTAIIPDPVYPVYLDSNLMSGRNITLIDGNEKNGFLPLPYSGLKGGIIYLCSPNNPTGAVYTKAQLKLWVDFANKNGAVILFDSAYEAFVQNPELPRSIYEIEGAKTCAVEFCSFSKTAGFTGTRCGYTVVPNDLKISGESLNAMWLRRQATKFNGTAYIIQRGAEAVFSKEGQIAVKNTLNYYRENALIMAETLTKCGIWFTGGENSPYLWLKCGMDSWEFFDLLLNKINVVGTPGAGFGKCGEGYFRLTAFNTKENTIEAMKRLKSLLS
ncbi:MAG: LL-diaminopimelate aminotransferase [Firmicutes bacterium]|nr:LL-diaminopimelate aminotransferase [Bacillota bacterium]